MRLAHGDLVPYRSNNWIKQFYMARIQPSSGWCGDSCSLVSDGGGIVEFDVGNCTSTMDSDGIVSVKMPLRVN